MKLKFQLNTFKKMVSGLKAYDGFTTKLQYTNSYLDAISSFNIDAFESPTGWTNERTEIVKEFVQESFALVSKLQKKGYSDGMTELALDYISMIEDNLTQFQTIKATKTTGTAKDIPATFEDMFTEEYRNRLTDVVSILREVTPPLITPENRFIDIRGNKGAMQMFILRLNELGIIKVQKNKSYASVINKYFPGLGVDFLDAGGKNIKASDLYGEEFDERINRITQ